MYAEGLPKPRWRYPEYHAWRMAIARCHNPKALAFKSYGGRGITVCQRWRDSFAAFLADMGPRPSPKHELDRENNGGHYEPSNCRWVRRWVNDRNRRSNRYVTYQGKRRLLLELCEEKNIWPDTVRWRLRKGWGLARSIETPARRKFGTKRGAITTGKLKAEAEAA